MRRILIRGGVAVVVIPVLWYFTSRWCALLVDQFYTPRLAILNNAPIGWNGTWLQIGTGVFDKVLPNGYRSDFTGMGPDYKQIARFIVDADDRLVFVKDDARFVLGPHTGTLPDPTLPDGEKPMPAFAPGPGDTMSAAIDRSLLSWPAPLIQFNFMTGYAPSWQRYIYQRFSWTKPSGARLDMLWRYRQDYDGVNGWTGMMLNDLIRIELRPATGSPIEWVETSK
ncbi:MAG TPA: hypothetical protein VGP42_01800 [Stellaceae bacterium]|jgi:hypothetical protein|nr:hypothetical protein [Stellaceae bacterium]